MMSPVGSSAVTTDLRPATARPASAADRSAMEGLRAFALAEMSALRGGELYGDREARALPDPGDETRPVWVGVLHGATVGYLVARIEPLPGGRVLGIVDAVYVEPGCRAVGVGEAMMAAALEWFRERRCVGVDAIALPGARSTKNFFEESGFTARLLVMHHRL
jgi:GNAT superfamily N-acetyltransferase